MDNQYYGEIGKLKEFRQFEDLTLIGYTFKNQTFDGYDVQTWFSRTKKIKSITRVSKCFYSGEKHCFKFVGYKFIDQKNNSYTYLSIEGEGVVRYSVNKEKYKISYVSIAIGLEDIYLDSIEEIEQVLNQQ
jgi:hypothetical protein